MEEVPIDLPQYQIDTIKGTSIAATVISLIASFALLIAYFKIHRTQRSFSMKLSIGLIVSSTIYSMANFLSLWAKNSIFCYSEGFLREYTFVSMLLWALTISGIAYISVKSFNRHIAEKFNLIAFLNHFISLFLAAVPVGLRKLDILPLWYGRRRLFCHLQPDDINIYANGFFILSVGIIIMIFSVQTTRILRAQKRTSVRVRQLRVLLYPFLLFTCWIPIIIHAIQDLEGQTIKFWVYMWHVLAVRMLGFFNALFFGKPIWRAMKQQRSSSSLDSIMMPSLRSLDSSGSIELSEVPSKFSSKVVSQQPTIEENIDQSFQMHEKGRV